MTMRKLRNRYENSESVDANVRCGRSGLSNKEARSVFRMRFASHVAYSCFWTFFGRSRYKNAPILKDHGFVAQLPQKVVDSLTMHRRERLIRSTRTQHFSNLDWSQMVQLCWKKREEIGALHESSDESLGTSEPRAYSSLTGISILSGRYFVKK